MKRYGTWNNVLKLAGMKVALNRNFTDEEMFEEIERIWILLGRQPTTTDIKSGISTFSLQSYARRFGGWRGALQAFIDYINEDFTQNSEDTNSVYLNNSQSTNDSDDKSQVIKHKTRRDINYVYVLWLCNVIILNVVLVEHRRQKTPLLNYISTILFLGQKVEKRLSRIYKRFVANVIWEKVI